MRAENEKDREFEEWLCSLSPVELELKKYYEKTHSLADQSYIMHLVNKASADDDYGLLFSPPDKKVLLAEKEGEYSDASWFLENEEVNIRAHLCYSKDMPHKHLFIEISYVLEGEALQSIYYDDGTVDMVKLTKGDFLIMPSGVTHENMVIREGRLINLLVKTSTMKSRMKTLLSEDSALFRFFLHNLYEAETPNYLLFHTGDDPEIRETIVKMAEELYAGRKYSNRMQILYLGMVFTYLQQSYIEAIHFSDKLKDGVVLATRILNHMNENYADIGVSDLAEHFGLSTSYLNKIFREHVGETPINVLMRIRIDAAKELLTNTEKAVGEIAEQVGYTDTTYFIRAFKKYTGETPAKYRKRHR